MDRSYENIQVEEKLRQQKIYEAASAASAPQGQTTGPGAALGYQQKRETLTERLRGRLNHAQQERSKVEQLDELIYLLNKNPEIARILDLVDAVGSY